MYVLKQFYKYLPASIRYRYRRVNSVFAYNESYFIKPKNINVKFLNHSCSIFLNSYFPLNSFYNQLIYKLKLIAKIMILENTIFIFNNIIG